MFGGITTVLGGDFLQTLPVIPQAEKPDILDATLLASPLWPKIHEHSLRLEENMHVGRDSSEREFAHWLWRLARGDLNHTDDNAILPDFLICPNNDLLTLIDITYPDLTHSHDLNYFHD